MGHGDARGGFVSLCSLSRKTAGRVRTLKRIYSSLCADGAQNETAAFFADNFHTILSAAGTRAFPKKPERLVYSDGEFMLAKALIDCSDDRFPDTDEIIIRLREASSGRKIFGCETEYLKFTVTYTLIEAVSEYVKSWDKNLLRIISLLSDVASIDEAAINDVLNPVAISLSSDGAYSKSDPKTQLLYREAIYATARKFSLDEIKLCEELKEKYSGEDIDISSLEVIKSGRKKPSAALTAAALIVLGAAAISLATAFWAEAPLAAALLFLPATEALRPLSDRILSGKRPPTRLMRLDLKSKEVAKTPVAIVLSAAVFDPEDASRLYDKLLKLHCLNPSENIKICALIDLAPEQVPMTSEDRAVIDSVSEAIERLEKICPEKFCSAIRKRTFSESQQEYMGRERKRGALMDIALYMKTGEGDFYATAGNIKSLVGTEYICAVDSDTLPLMDSVNELLAIALHPANKVSVKNGRVVKGFGVVAPRMVTRLKDSIRSEFSKSLGGIGSKSSYDEEAANLYQDVFGQGTFCGKGLINVTALTECASCLKGERILSHDILEGELLKTACAGDVLFTEGFPKTPQSYYRRLDRWIRGDFQNIPELFSKRFSALSKLKLADNLRRAAIPPTVFSAFFLGFFIEPVSSAIIAGSALALWLLPAAVGALGAFFSDRTRSRRFYSGIISSASQSVRYILYSTVMLPVLAVKSLVAIFTAIIRLFTGRGLLNWTTADSADRSSQSPFAFYLLPELLSVSLLWSPDYLIRLFGAIFISMPALLCLDRQSASASEVKLKYRDGREISKQTADMWGFFENYVTRADNYLPPDNVQFAPVFRVAHRTSPTNIGLYLLSALAAFDRKLINRDQLLSRLEKTVSTVERLEKYAGNLYNWYDTKTLKICPAPFVSSVDSGNFTVCLVTLKEGLYELEQTPAAAALIKRIEKLIDSCDLGVFYDPIRGLMSLGIDPEKGKNRRSHYDYMMSEARLASFWAIASRQVPKSHWQRLSRAMLRCGFFGGAASYSGTMFEFFMPEIFLKSPEGSLFGESLRYALWVQKKYAKDLGRPFGVSESGYYSFDSALNYRYMAHGVPNTGIGRGLGQSYVVSPYSTFISLGYSGGEGVENLRKIAEFGMYGSYGLYEALDFTPPDSEKPEPVRSYMAHHVGMSILSCDNVLSGGIMQKRFAKDPRVCGALELLDERFHLGTAVFENDLRRPKLSEPTENASETESFSEFSLFAPRIKLLCNGELTLMITDSGASASIYRSKNVYLRTRDLLSRPKGVFCFLSDGGEALPFSPLLGKSDGMSAEFSDDGAAFYLNTEKLSSGMKISLHENYPCEIRRFALKNETSAPLSVSVISYIEPSLQDDRAERAHPAFSKMFLRLERDPEWNVCVVTRVREDRKIYLGIGFVEDVRETVSFDRGDVLRSQEGLKGLSKRFEEISPSLVCEPDPCVFIRAFLELPPKAETELTMFLALADSKEELVNRISAIRRKKPRFCTLPRLDTARGRVASALLADILFDLKKSPQRIKAAEKNRLPLRALWELSVSTDLPLAAVELNGRNDAQKLSAYLGAYKLLRLCGVELQIVFIFDDGGRYEREHYSDLIAAARAEGLESSVYSSGGILPLDLSKTREGLSDLCRAAACHLCSGEIAPTEQKTETKPIMEILPSLPKAQKVEIPIALGGFSGEGYVINEKPPLPWCHVLSNPVFGTLLSNASLGFSFAFNSRENRLTPWDNDPAEDNSGERLLIKINGKVFDLINGAAAVFSPYKAEYFSCGEGFEATITVEVSAKGMCKKISAKIETKSPAEIIYYVEPCMGSDRSRCGLIVPERAENGILFAAPASDAAGFMFIGASKPCKTVCSREAFWAGETEGETAPSPDVIGAVSVCCSGKEKIDFFMTYALSKRAAKIMPKYFLTQTDSRELIRDVKTGDPASDILSNRWLRYQALHARIYARTGFWQCSGAYGFRDQLQDAACIAPENPSVLKTQILRCCMAQFRQGDVLHWWHSLPGCKTKGIRTLISDDALWLPFALSEYLEITGDRSILSLEAAYCDGLELHENEKERYGEVYKTALRESVYLHCRRAVDLKAGKTGRHGLMLIGSGDWNDGFNRVGQEGIGESVWLSEFYIIVLKRFAKIAESVGDMTYAGSLKEYAAALSGAVEASGRDENYYLRGYFDGGAKLGSQKNQECKIDSVAQSFAEFAGLGKDGFSKKALQSACEALFDEKRGIVKLFAPAFSDSADPDPGYVKDYPEGIRENGGQYTHAAVWLAMACLRAGLFDEGRKILEAISPIRRSQNGGYAKYMTEPYYLCGDVYSNKNCLGRGGWSIYTGSAAWYYRAMREGWGKE